MKKQQGTKYYLMRRCMACYHVQEMIGLRCTQCNELFIGQASEEEKNKINKKLAKLQHTHSIFEGVDEESDDKLEVEEEDGNETSI